MFVSSSGRIGRKHAAELVKYFEGKSQRRNPARVEGYLEHGPQAVWLGKGAAAFDLAGAADSRSVTRILDGFAPEAVLVDGEWVKTPLCADAGKPEGWAGIDFTLSVPKSVSIAWALADEATRREIEGALSKASATFVEHLERNAACMRRDDPVTHKTVHEKSAGLIATAYRHDTSRPVDGFTAPQLHDHILIAAIAPRRVAARGQFAVYGKIDTQPLYALRGEAAAVASTVMVRALRDLGYVVEREGPAWEIAGIGKEVRDAFSPRSHQVQAALDEMTAAQAETPTRAQTDLAVLRTRQGKEGLPADYLFDDWQARAARLGLDASGLRPGSEYDTRPLPERWSSVVADAIAHLEEKRASWEVGHLLLQVAIEAELSMSAQEVSLVLDQVRDAAANGQFGLISPVLIEKGNGHLTSKAAVDREMRVLDRVTALSHGEQRKFYDPWSRKAAQELGIELSDDQVAAVTLAVSSPVCLVEAPAGTGKGTVAKVVASVEQAQGHKVIAIATSGNRASEFGNEIDANAICTVERFVSDVRRGRLRLHDGDTIMIDEAGQLETRRWDALLLTVGERQVRLALFGDREQMDAIEVGGLLRPLAEAIPTATLTTNWRNAKDAELWDNLRSGRAADAVVEYDLRGQASVQADQDAAIAALLADYKQDRALDLRAGEFSALIVTDRSNRVIDRINSAAQSVAGLDRPGLTVTYTDPETDYVRVETLRVGDPVTATGQINRELQVTTGRSVNVRNGSVGVVSDVDERTGQVVVDWKTKGEVAIDPVHLDRLRLAYCRHAFNAQGTTVDRVYDLVGGWQTGKASGYVAVTRARQSSRIYSDREALGLEADATKEQELAALARAFTRDRAQEAAVTALPELGDDELADHQVEKWTRELPASEPVAESKVIELSPERIAENARERAAEPDRKADPIPADRRAAAIARERAAAERSPLTDPALRPVELDRPSIGMGLSA